MVAYNFHPKFVNPIVAYRKRRTVRQNGKRRHARPGEFLQLYTGMRTRNCKKIIESDVICVEVAEISIEVAVDQIDRICVNGTTIADTIEEFARDDGFSGARSMHKFWLSAFGPGVFEGTLICWLLCGICQCCGCTDVDCSQCVEAQGEPCHWVDEHRTICSRCYDEIEAKFGGPS
jgi:hypothetical protein